MSMVLKSFGSLYFATVLMLLGSGLLGTYLALRLAQSVDSLWVGALMAAYYFGLVLGGKVGHRLIARVGHIRAYTACAGVVTAAVLGHGLIDWLPLWLLLRILVGLGMMCQYMVIESWLNEQAQDNQRGMVFSGYMAASYLGMILGQLMLVVHPGLDLQLLIVIALCFALCLVPVALTRRVHPAPLHPAPLEPRFFLGRVPLSLTTVVVAGFLIGSFYGLAPLYAARVGMANELVGLFMGSCILAGFLVQWPLGWLSDRIDRVKLIRTCAALLLLSALPLAIAPSLPMPVLLVMGFVVSLMLFSLYPLAVALSNDHVEPNRRVSLTAMLLVTFGIGACIGPLVTGVLMRYLGPNMLYTVMCVCALVLAWRVRPDKVTNRHQVQNAPVQHMLMPGEVAGSPLVAALDPRVYEKAVSGEEVNESRDPRE